MCVNEINRKYSINRRSFSYDSRDVNASHIICGFRLRLAGYKAMYVADTVVYHAGSATTGGQRSDFSVYHGHRNLLWTFMKNMPGIFFVLLLPIHLILNAVNLIYFAWLGQWQIICRAKVGTLKRLVPIWRLLDKWPAERNNKTL